MVYNSCMAQNFLFTTMSIILITTSVKCDQELSPSSLAPASRPIQKQVGKGSPYGTPFDDNQSAKEKANLTLVNMIGIVTKL